MAELVRISSIRITSGKNVKVLTKNEIKKFCAERVRITVTENKQNSQDNAFDCRVVLRRLSQKYITNAISGQIAQNEQKSKVETFSKVRYFLYHFIWHDVNLMCHLPFKIFVILPKVLITFSYNRLSRLSFVEPKAKKKSNWLQKKFCLEPVILFSPK